jgi:hypothetical protein
MQFQFDFLNPVMISICYLENKERYLSGSKSPDTRLLKPNILGTIPPTIVRRDGAISSSRLAHNSKNIFHGPSWKISKIFLSILALMDSEHKPMNFICI